ncbi:hypothetical protein [Persicobacter psychrovividus]
MIKQFFFMVLLLTASANVWAQSAEPDISPDRKQAIDSLALEKVRDLSKYITIIGDKKTRDVEANAAIERAVELFDADAQIDVSSLNTQKTKAYGVKDYLKRLKLLNYDQVNIEWFHIQYISDLVKQADGRYVGVITIYQRFEGKRKDGMKYVDTTKKDITVYVERKKTTIQGRTIGFWDVMLGDIRVTNTYK